MNERSAALVARIASLHEEAQAVAATFDTTASSKRLLRRLTTATTGVATSYGQACSAGGRDSFIVHVSAAARHAKRAKQILQELTQLNCAGIDTTRELILEARGIEAILSASKNTAKRRKAARAIR